MIELNQLMLKALEKGQENTAPEYYEDFVHPIYGVLKYRALTKAEKREFMLGQSINVDKDNKAKLSIGDTLKTSTKFIYNCFGLAPYAEQAKREGKIVKYYDILDVLFEISDLLTMTALIFEKSNIASANDEIKEDVEEVKKP